MNWLVAYSALLGPVVGVVLADYYVVRDRRLDIDDLYSMETTGRYWYQVNSRATMTVELMLACVSAGRLCPPRKGRRTLSSSPGSCCAKCSDWLGAPCHRGTVLLL